MGRLSTFRAAMQQLRGQLGDDWDRIKHMSIIDEDGSEKCAARPCLLLSSCLAVRVESRLLEGRRCCIRGLILAAGACHASSVLHCLT